MGYSKICYLISKYLGISQIPSYYWFLSNSFVVREYTLYDLNPFTFISTCFMAQNMVYLDKCSHALEKIVYTTVAGEVLYKC